ncbi:unnamed protein product [Closterium sp. NIES-53]
MSPRPSSVPQRVVLPSPPATSLPDVADPSSDMARVSSPTVTRFLATAVTDPTFSSPAASSLVAELVDFAAVYHLDYLASLVSDPDLACPPSIRGQPSRGDLAAPPAWLHWVVSCRYPVEPPAASLQSPLDAPRVARHTKDYTCGSCVCSFYYWPVVVFAHRHYHAAILRSRVHHPGRSTAHHHPDSVTHRPYPELVGCLMYLMTCTRPDLAYPLSLLARYVTPGRHRKVHWDAAKRVLRYLCSTSGMGLVLGGRGSVVLTGHSGASWADDQATQRSSQGYTFSLGSGSVSWRSTRSSSVLGSSCEAEIYAGAMAAQELR